MNNLVAVIADFPLREVLGAAFAKIERLFSPPPSPGKLDCTERSEVIIMAGLRDLLNKGRDNDAEAQKIVKPLAKEFPLVAELLGGMPEKGDQAAISPGTVTFFVHDGKMRFSANVKSAEKTFIGDVADILNPWGSINTALLTGDVSSKRYTERPNSSLTKEKEGLLY